MRGRAASGPSLRVRAQPCRNTQAEIYLGSYCGTVAIDEEGREAVTRCNGVSRALLPHQQTLIATVVSDRLEMLSCVRIRKESIHAIDNQCLIDQFCTKL